MGRAVPDLLADLLRTDPGRPLVVYYGHDADGAVVDRTELSVTTYANWVAKAAGLLSDELDLERGDVLQVDLGATHWLSPVFWVAAWSAGIGVAVGGAAHTGPDAVVCGPATLEGYAGSAADRPTLACALTPFARRFSDPLPADVIDVGVAIWGQPDAFVAFDPPQADDVAFLHDAEVVRQGDLARGVVSAPTAADVRLVQGLDGDDVAAARACATDLLAGTRIVLVDDAAPHAAWWPQRLASISSDERL